MQEPRKFTTKTVVIDSVTETTESGKTYMRVIDKGGGSWKVKEGKNGALKEKWGLLKSGVAIQLTIGEFKGYPYVEDFNTCINQLEAKAAKDLQEKQRDSKEASIECQVAVKAITDLEIAGIVSVSKDLKDARDSWLRHALREFIK